MNMLELGANTILMEYEIEWNCSLKSIENLHGESIGMGSAKINFL